MNSYVEQGRQGLGGVLALSGPEGIENFEGRIEIDKNNGFQQ